MKESKRKNWPLLVRGLHAFQCSWGGSADAYCLNECINKSGNLVLSFNTQLSCQSTHFVSK